MEKIRQIISLIKELTTEDYEAAMEIVKCNIGCSNDDLHQAIQAIGRLDFCTVKYLQEIQKSQLIIDEIKRSVEKGEYTTHEQIDTDESE